MASSAILEPWGSFLHEIDRNLTRGVQLHCLGGFVIVQVYGLERNTADIDVVSVQPFDKQLLEVCGKGSPLHAKHGVYLQYVGVASFPYEYEQRLLAIFEGEFKQLRLRALEPHDLALSKLVRNNPIDRDDVMRMARMGLLNANTLEERYRTELRPYVPNPHGREDTTLAQWLEWYFPSG